MLCALRQEEVACVSSQVPRECQGPATECSGRGEQGLDRQGLDGRGVSLGSILSLLENVST